MEVFLAESTVLEFVDGLLHARGGVSIELVYYTTCLLSSPRSWRCFHRLSVCYQRKPVFSTLVEVFPKRIGSLNKPLRLLHARGGVSKKALLQGLLVKSSPRSWRCFPLKANKHHGIVVFSTLVEVFPVPTTVGCSHVSLLHARGGVSQTDDQLEITIESSPRSWRCFPNLTTEQEAEVVFSTLVEVFLNIKSLRQLGCSLLHARGGVSIADF